VSAAICFSIAVPALKSLNTKKHLKNELARIKQEIAAISTFLDQLLEGTKNYLVSQEQAKNEIFLLPDLAVLESKLNEKIEFARELLRKSKQYSIARNQAIYQEAYDRGAKCELSDKIVFAPHELSRLRYQPVVTYRNGSYNPSRTEKRAPEDTEINQDSGYLHQQLRRLLEYNHQKNKHLLNGED
jgi:hypothetical protein